MTNRKQQEKTKLIYSSSESIMDTLKEAGVEYFFVTLGSDHASIIESWAAKKSKDEHMPKIIICPHEFLTLTIAHGFTQVTGRPQAVFVHVDVGTQNLGGSIHNVMRGRIPVLIFAGMSPATAEGELMGSRNEFIHYLQDVPDQSGILRQYMKYSHTVHSGKNVDKIINRALQIAKSEPQGPVYLMAPREVLSEEVEKPTAKHENFPSVSAGAVEEKHIQEIVHSLKNAKNPVILTSYLGRKQDSVNELIYFAEKFSIPVVEAGPFYMNFPSTHPLHQGYEDYTGNNESINRLKTADTILVFDADVPWIPMMTELREDAVLYWIDMDPIKENIPLWYYPTKVSIKADSYLALKQLNKYADTLELTEEEERVIKERFIALTKEHDLLQTKPKSDMDLVITPDFLSSTINEIIDEDTIVVNETISNFGSVWRNIPRNIPGTLYGSGASSLGWHGGAAMGIKLANPDKPVVALTGDGTYMFSVPSSVHWISSKYKIPFLTVIYNNRGWKSPKLSTLGVHPDGVANQNDTFWVNFGETAKYEKIAEASGGALALEVREPEKLKEVLRVAYDTVLNGRSAVVNVFLDPASMQDLNENIIDKEIGE